MNIWAFAGYFRTRPRSRGMDDIAAFVASLDAPEGEDNVGELPLLMAASVCVITIPASFEAVMD